MPEIQHSELDHSTLASVLSPAEHDAIDHGGDAPSIAAAWTEVNKTADEDRSNTATPTNDSQLTFVPPSIGVYEIEAWIFYSAYEITVGADLTAPDMTSAWENMGTNGVTMRLAINNVDTPQMDWSTYAWGTNLVVGTAATKRLLFYKGWAYLADAISTRAFQWAQGTASLAAGTRVHAGSMIRYRKVAS